MAAKRAPRAPLCGGLAAQLAAMEDAAAPHPATTAAVPWNSGGCRRPCAGRRGPPGLGGPATRRRREARKRQWKRLRVLAQAVAPATPPARPAALGRDLNPEKEPAGRQLEKEAQTDRDEQVGKKRASAVDLFYDTCSDLAGDVALEGDDVMDTCVDLLEQAMQDWAEVFGMRGRLGVKEGEDSTVVFVDLGEEEEASESDGSDEMMMGPGCLA
mmetsp:Transcript_94382/g.266957  ORF Transcript_94382/g.266957 Transcript_94382/m.266957 type:complete len:214 (+) Transcript_94382:1-642(+)